MDSVERDYSHIGTGMMCARCGCAADIGPDGLWHCIATPKWCQAYPMPGREDVPSSALTKEEWDREA